MQYTNQSRLPVPGIYLGHFLFQTFIPFEDSVRQVLQTYQLLDQLLLTELLVPPPLPQQTVLVLTHLPLDFQGTPHQTLLPLVLLPDPLEVRGGMAHSGLAHRGVGPSLGVG